MSEGRPRLRVGVLVDGPRQQRWVRRLLERIRDSSFAELVAVVRNDSADLPRRSLAQRLRAHPEAALFHLYAKVDARLFGRPDDALAETDVSDLFAGVPEISVRPRRTTWSDYFPDDALEAVAAQRPDVLLRFGFRILRGAILGLPRYGVWSYHHGDNRVNRGGPPGWWELYGNEPTTGVTLQVLSEALDGGRVIARTLAATDPRSMRRTCVPSYWKGAALAARKLRELHEEGESALEDVDRDAFPVYDRRLFRVPTNRETLRGVRRIAAGWARDKLAGVGTERDQWCLAASVEPGFPPAYRFRLIEPPADRFWADPWPVERDGRYYVFLEELVYREGRGAIAVLEIDAKGNHGAPSTVLSEPHHLSYPALFTWRGELFMTPESAQAGRVDVYRCTRFPGEWTHEQTLFEGVRAVDATIFEHAGRWWLFANVAEPGASNNDELHLFHAPAPLGPWQPHPRNPVVSDVSRARPAGLPFVHGGRLFRPAQDCAERYGRAIAINEVLRIDPQGYQERLVTRIEPLWDPRIRSTHTLNRAGSLTVIDVRRRR